MTNPDLWIVAGVNGSGKSTFIDRFNRHHLPVVNPDNIVLTLNHIAPLQRNAQAGRLALEQRTQLLQNHQSFAIETTLTGNSEFTLLKKAKALGYRINLVYIGLESKELSRSRINARVLSGGHNIPIQDILRRYNKSLANLSKAIELSDHVYIFDNSSLNRKKRLVINHQKINYIAANIPQWLQVALNVE